MKKTLKYLSIAAVGGLAYNFLEIVWRGYTHISMTVAGGVCLVLIYIVNERFPSSPLIIKSLAGAVIITAVEFISGYIVNIKRCFVEASFSSLYNLVVSTVSVIISS